MKEPDRKKPSHHAVKRREPRYDLLSPVEFVSAEADDRIQKGVAINISKSGLCVCSFAPLTRGQEITIKSLLPIPHKTMTVQWTSGFIAGLWEHFEK